ncbi:MAG: 6-bladed beta-propeller [Candidatus Aminicenantes bacterium]|nr:6-bladed beta-propeller [Candidatus Aminicenantes bacterium]
MNKKIYSLLVFFLVIFSTISSFQKETLAEETNIIQKSDDVVVVSNQKIPELKMRIVFKEELSIGDVEGEENYMFGESVAFNTDEDGNFYVADFDTHRILKYDSEGKYLLAFGREGQGPGEFQSLSIPRFDKNNNLYITDARNRRISFFDKDGKYLKQIRMTEIHVNPFINSKGFILANKFNIAEEGNNQKRTSIYGLFDDKFNLVVELYKDETKFPLPTGLDASSMAEYIGKVFSLMAFRPQVVTALANNDSIYLGYPDKYEINVYSHEGMLARKITRDYDPIPVKKKDEESFVKIAGENLPNPPFTEDIKNKALQKIKYPKYKPAYQSFTLMDNGWLAVIVDAIEDEYTLFDIFNQEGKYIAHFKTPVLVEGMFSALLFFKNGKAYAVEDEDGYKFVKRYNFEIQEYKDNKWVRKK